MMPSKQKLTTWKIFKPDIISNLPDFVLSHILSFLPSTKEVVATSILSKRWRHVWAYVDRLIFDNSRKAFKTDKLFTQYVDTFLERHQGDIKEFKLCCYKYEFQYLHVPTWIDIAIARGVEILDLRFITFVYDFEIPDSLLASKTITVLKLNLSYVIVKNPSTPILPRLKKLDVPLDATQSEVFKRILSECSTLEYLVVKGYGTQIDIVSSSVKWLTLDCYNCDWFDPKIVLGLPALEYVEINCQLPSELIVEDELSSLIEARVCFYDACYQPYHHRYVTVKQFRNAFVRFMKPFSNVKVLRVGTPLQRFLNSVGHGLFLNLTKLDIVSKFYEWRLLVNLMESSINLQTISLIRESTLKKHRLAWIEPKKVPICLSLSLKKMSIGNGDGYDSEDDDELSMVKYVLGTAQILERMDIYCPNDVIQEIQKFPRACARCEISQLKKLPERQYSSNVLWKDDWRLMIRCVTVFVFRTADFDL